MICLEINCEDYLIDDGDPAWCYHAGQPAQVAVAKCPKIAANQIEKEKNIERTKHEN